MNYNNNPTIRRKPFWFKQKIPASPKHLGLKSLLQTEGINTVCQMAKCPNIWECFSNNTATFLIMGQRCTRRCRFCAIEYGPVATPDLDEPLRIAKTVKKMGLSYVVITSVTRDDLPDGGASFFGGTIREIRREMPDILIEVLVPDFLGKKESLEIVLHERPTILNHNIETVKRLYEEVRPGACYNRSIGLFKKARSYATPIITKSGLILGLGETERELENTLSDLLNAGCTIITLGQYLQPSKNHLPVQRYITPDEFKAWEEIALKMGFSQVRSGPLVRSSYHAKEMFVSVLDY